MIVKQKNKKTLQYSLLASFGKYLPAAQMVHDDPPSPYVRAAQNSRKHGPLSFGSGEGESAFFESIPADWIGVEAALRRVSSHQYTLKHSPDRRERLQQLHNQLEEATGSAPGGENRSKERWIYSILKNILMHAHAKKKS